MKWDLIVVGAGPAGSAAAIAARKANPNASVLILDKELPGRDKVCGDGGGPLAWLALASWVSFFVTRDDEVGSDG